MPKLGCPQPATARLAVPCAHATKPNWARTLRALEQVAALWLLQKGVQQQEEHHHVVAACGLVVVKRDAWASTVREEQSYLVMVEWAQGVLTNWLKLQGARKVPTHESARMHCQQPSMQIQQMARDCTVGFGSVRACNTYPRWSSCQK